MSGVWGLGFGVWGLGFGVWGLGFGIQGLGFGVWCFVFGIWDLVSDVWCSVLVSGAWCWSLVFGAWHLAFGIWCLGFGILGVVIGVWCLGWGFVFRVESCVLILFLVVGSGSWVLSLWPGLEGSRVWGLGYRATHYPLYTSLCTGELNAIRKHKCFLCSPFYVKGVSLGHVGRNETVKDLKTLVTHTDVVVGVNSFFS